MANDTIITDDYVAELLAKEASEASIKYSSMGLEAFRSTSTKPANKAKPNTNFLTRIIRETDSHNAAIKAREAAEAQARLSGLEEAEEKKRLKTNPSLQDIRRRQLGAISSLLSGQKKRRGAEEDVQSSVRASSRDRKDSKTGDKEKHKRSESRRSDNEDTKDASRERRHHHHHRHHRDEERSSRNERRHRDRSRSRSPRHRERRHRHRSRSPLSSDQEGGKHSRSSHKSRSSRSEKESRSRKDRDIIPEKSSTHRRHGRLAEKEVSENEESDPLEDLIGPAAPPPADAYPPPVRTRGRGAGRGGAAMDGRFASDYDPSEDMQLDETDLKVSKTDDWDDMVESFRDRQKWLKQGADRLRAAGFSEEDIKKWEKTGPNGEKDIEDVTWTKAGEKREWDKGKGDN
ncbi:hypothetical protein SMACR_05418 [Sordaria macrospora]|uniref:WGS project CABT00000000 data, contig 2.6 n=2 Tax=Sordaria macrospora TaxID=5147 RepID=F7VSW1_SORMK|nr:uncharacterized protein SMAC_05418 [Sordaria macrospora k-hell]KAA8628440.1 hypothetical protein SMACR_05418 [Sordaria macrospora]KAH7628461.1 hypothetical protein B0T09DRAFT_343856 [Sordaria sp. MPI-SDFR-AT-0083]WPJ57590.1 hypothetical protein SMAC4_05418 [Sordaria macrospora]CCC08778.1 unnamed protein product [Sordaria macrospora k-hell]